MSKFARRGVAVFAAVMLLAATLMALTITPAAAASLRIGLKYEAEGENTKVTVIAINPPDICDMQLDFDMTGKTYISGASFTKGFISQVGLNATRNVVIYLALTSVENPYECFEKDADGNVVLCSFVYFGGGKFSGFEFVGGRLAGDPYEAEDITGASIVDISDDVPAPTPVPIINDRTPSHQTMIGTLADCEGNPLSGYNVILQGTGGLSNNCYYGGAAPFYGPALQTATTDKEGKFVFTNLDEGKYTMTVQDSKCNTIATKNFKLEEGKAFSASADTVVFAHGTNTFALNVTLDSNKNIIFGTPVACGETTPAKAAAPAASATGFKSPNTGAGSSWLLFGLIQILCVGAGVALAGRRRAGLK